MRGHSTGVKPIAITAFFALTAHFAPAWAQFVTEGADLNAPAGEAVDETDVKGRLSTSGVYYGESSDAVVDPNANTGDDPASGQHLLYTDLRGHVEAAHIEGGRWDALGDFRLRLPADQVSARGYLGGRESDLREAYVVRRGVKTDFALGRMIIRDVDATTIDGLRMVHRLSNIMEVGAFGGLFPNPFSRNLSTDYRDGHAPQDQALAGGAWVGYRTARAYGAIGGAAIAPRDDAAVDPEPDRGFLTVNGYLRASPGLDVFHYGVLDLMGRGGTQLLNAQLGVHWRKSPDLLLEAAVSHLSTYAIELYVRDYLEAPDTSPMPGRIQNNLFVARMASNEARAGADYTFREKRLDVYGQVRYRRRATVASDELPTEIASLPADTQVDLSGGLRWRRAVIGWTVGVDGVYISGDRTESRVAILRAERGFRDDSIDVTLDASYLQYEDSCPAAGDPTCTGAASGDSAELGGTVVWRRDRHWMFLGDYHYGRNNATSTRTGVAVDEPAISSQSLFVRGQYAF